MTEPRSGDIVASTVQTVGIVMSLITPWIHPLVASIEVQTGVPLGAAYEAQILTALTGLCMLAGARWRMRQIRRDGPVVEPARPGSEA